MWNGPALMFLAAASALLFGLSLIFAWSDTVRGLREFFQLRRSRSLVFWLVIVAATAVMGIGIGFVEYDSIYAKLVVGGIVGAAFVFLLGIVWIIVLFVRSVFSDDGWTDIRELRKQQRFCLPDDLAADETCQAARSDSPPLAKEGVLEEEVAAATTQDPNSRAY